MSYLARQRGSFRSLRVARDADVLLGNLSADERSVLVGIVQGHSLREIADRMGISEPEAEVTMSNILRKCNVRTTADLVRIGIYAEIGGDADP